MRLHAFYAVLALLGFLGEIALLVVLLVRRQYKTFPLFTFYILFNVVCDFALSAILAAYPPRVGRAFEFSILPLTYLLELGVLFEIGSNVLHPLQNALPRRAMRWFGGLIVLCLLGGFLLAWHVPDSGNKINDLRAALNLTVGFLRLLLFAAIAGFAQVLGIGWKNKVLRLATALSFYSAVDLMVSLLERHANDARALEPVRGAAYLLEIGFLMWAFTTKDVRRREFSPQMEQFLVTLAGRAKVARTALARTVK